jgi:PAS domain S-box-containing protein
MVISFRTTRRAGLATLFMIILLESLFSFVTMWQSYERLTHIITVEEVKLRRWYDVAEIITTAKDQLNDYRLGKIEFIAAVDLLVNRAMKDMQAIKELTTGEDEVFNIKEIVKAANKLKQEITAYAAHERADSRDKTAAGRMEELVVTADRIAQLSEEAASYVSKRIETNNRALLELTDFSQKMLGFVLFVALVATIVVALIMARALAVPIEQLVKATQRIADGDFSYRVQIESEDEIGQLAASFNQMAEILKKSRQKLLTAKEYTENIIKSMINSLVVVNYDTSIRAANQATYDMLGYDQGELIGKPLATIFADGYYEEIRIDDLITKGFRSNIETVYQTKDGRKIRVLFSGSIIFDDEGTFDGLLCVAQDITIQSETLRAGHLASIGELAAGVAHEINNPINGIINFAQIIIDEVEKGEMPTKDIPAMIIKEGDRVAAIVSSLLSFARESENVMGPINVHAVLHDVLTLTKAQLTKDSIGLTLDLPDDLADIYCNFQQVEQVFLNIINNSRYALNKKFPGSSPDKTLSISAREKIVADRQMVEIVFHDHGIGIPANIIDKVLNPFFSTKPSGSGTGLGLAISHGIITTHGGKLFIESREGEYTKVTTLFQVAPDNISPRVSPGARPRGSKPGQHSAVQS